MLWYTIGGQALAIGLGLLILISVIFGAFSLGSWWTHQVMQSGARIALEAQASDDNRDQIQLRSIANILKDFSMLSRELSRQTPKQVPGRTTDYPPRLVEQAELPSRSENKDFSESNGDQAFVEAEFEIGGMVEDIDDIR